MTFCVLNVPFGEGGHHLGLSPFLRAETALKYLSRFPRWHIQEDTSHRQHQLADFYVSEYIGLHYMTPLVSVNLALQIYPEIHFYS